MYFNKKISSFKQIEIIKFTKIKIIINNIQNL